MARTVGKFKSRRQDGEDDDDEGGFESFEEVRTDPTQNPPSSTSSHTRPGPAQAGPSGIKKRKLDSASGPSHPIIIEDEESGDGLDTSGANRLAAVVEDDIRAERAGEIVELPPTTTGKGKGKAGSVSASSSSKNKANKAPSKIRQPSEGPVASTSRNRAGGSEAGLSGSSAFPLRFPLHNQADPKKSDSQWQATVDRLIKERDTFAQQFRDLAHMRETEAEKSLREYRLATEQHGKTQDGIIQRLTTQISRMDELAKSGRHSSLSLLTREASDVRFQQYEARLREQEAEIAELKKFVEEKDKELQAKDGEIREIKRELAAEIELSRKNLELQQKARLQASHGSSTSQVVGQGIPVSPRNGFQMSANAHIICLYEELSKVLVTNCKRKRGPNGEEPLFTCVITNKQQSLHFTLEHTREIIEASDMDKPSISQDWLWYVPMNLDKESQDFIGNLGFLSSSFKFPQDQGLHFLGQLLRRMGFEVPYVKSAGEDDDTEQDDENALTARGEEAMEDEIQVLEHPYT